jgi:hypothetical protein
VTRARKAAWVIPAVVLLAFGASRIEARVDGPGEPPLLSLVPLGRLDTGVDDTGLLTSANPALGLTRVRGAGASALRIVLPWASVAPQGSLRPAGFDAADPRDPRYRWTAFDKQVQLIVAHGLQPIVVIFQAPAWAEGKGDGPKGTRRPDPGELGLFAMAAARRYSGSFEGLPRVRYWQIWNEPNLDMFLSPQVSNGTLVSGNWYRRMVNAAASAIHTANRGNIVVAGGTSPFGRHGWYWATSPLEFTRQVLCMRGRRAPSAACALRTAFDVWAHHPYTDGGPSHHASRPDDVSLPDLPKLQRLLSAAWAAREVIAARRPPLWVTEFSWDTNPPDPRALPTRLQARWVSEALYRMWRSGVSLVTWFQLRDEPLSKSNFQSGLYFYDGPFFKLNRPKPALTAFRFPFVAFRSHGRVFVWGRTPDSAPHAVVVQQVFRGRWHRVRVVRANRYGIFTARMRVPLRGRFRALLAGETASLAFALKAPADVTISNPFGS